MRPSLKLFFFALLAAVYVGCAAAPALADAPIVQGYARPDYRDLMQTVVVLGGVDIADPKVAENYARLVECAAYQRSYADDFSWNGIRQKVIDRVRARKESYRTHYEYGGVVLLERYDFAKRIFPFTAQTRFSNVGRMEIMSYRDAAQSLCTAGGSANKQEPYFPLSVALTLDKPLDLKGFSVEPDKAEALLSTLQARGNAERAVFVRFRFKVVGQPKIVLDRNGQMTRVDLPGGIEAIDIFHDRDMTAWIASVPVL